MILLVCPVPKINVLIKSYHIAIIVLPLKDKVMIQNERERKLLARMLNFFQYCNVVHSYKNSLETVVWIYYHKCSSSNQTQK